MRELGFSSLIIGAQETGACPSGTHPVLQTRGAAAAAAAVGSGRRGFGGAGRLGGWEPRAGLGTQKHVFRSPKNCKKNRFAAFWFPIPGWGQAGRITNRSQI